MLVLANGNPGKMIARPASSFDKSGQASRGICRCIAGMDGAAHGTGWMSGRGAYGGSEEEIRTIWKLVLYSFELIVRLDLDLDVHEESVGCVMFNETAQGSQYPTGYIHGRSCEGIECWCSPDSQQDAVLEQRVRASESPKDHSTPFHLKTTIAAHTRSLRLYNVNGAFAGIKIWTVADKCTKQRPRPAG